MEHEDFMKHEKTHELILKEKEEKRQKERERIEQMAASYKAPYESLYYKRVVARDLELSRSRNILPNSRLVMKEYGDKVKTQFIPSIDESKRAFFDGVEDEIRDDIENERNKYYRDLQIQQNLK